MTNTHQNEFNEKNLTQCKYEIDKLKTELEAKNKELISLKNNIAELTEKKEELEQENSELKYMEEVVDQAQEKYHSIFNNATEGIYQALPDGCYISVNPALVKMLGYDSSLELTTNMTDVREQLYVDSSQYTEFINAVQEKNAVYDFECQVYKKDKSIIWISENRHAMRDTTGELLYYEGTLVDITKRKLAEEALNISQLKLRMKNQEMQEDLDLAIEFQQAMLPKTPVLPYLEMDIMYLPFTGVSGDTYIISTDKDQTLNLFQGDATGHGIAAAIMAMMVKVGIESLPNNLSTDDILRQLNILLASSTPKEKFISCIYLRITSEGLLTFCNAGHPPLFIIPGNGDKPIFFEKCGLALGMFPDEYVPYQEFSYQLKTNDKVYVYTDGITEWGNPQKKFYGQDRLFNLFKNKSNVSLKQIREDLLDDLYKFARGIPPTDDVTAIGIHYKGLDN